jgi:hypothetical protein
MGVAEAVPVSTRWLVDTLQAAIAHRHRLHPRRIKTARYRAHRHAGGAKPGVGGDSGTRKREGVGMTVPPATRADEVVIALQPDHMVMRVLSNR